MRGMVFDIREFTVHDGPGIRVTVFLKGCPLRCSWCHNPEGLSFEPQVMRGPAGTRTAGFAIEAGDLAARLRSQARLLAEAEGGVTFSGGEPLAQAPFVAATIDLLEGLHVVLDTSGYAPEDAFRSVAGRADLVYFDLKILDPGLHLRFTGANNGPILRNLDALETIGVPYILRVPLVPGVTDTPENLRGIARRAAGRKGLRRVDLLPYNKAAGGKYAACGLVFNPGFDESRAVNADTGPFTDAGIEARIA